METTEFMEQICDMMTAQEILEVCQVDKWELVSEILADDVITFWEQFEDAMDEIAASR